jgi:ribose transport system ATP-binding protein
VVVAGEPALDVRGLSKTFPAQRALDDVSVSMRRGEAHGLLGENGSGKSTLIKILSGFHLPDPGGEIRVDGAPLPPGAPEESRRLGLRFVHQQLAIIPQMTAVENVALASGYQVGWTRRIDLDVQAERTRRLLERFGVEVDLWTPLGRCRPIDRTMVAIARALDGLDGEHGVLVLDEPTAALPPEEVQRLFALVRELTRQGVTTVYVTHRLDEVFELVERVSILRDGRMQGTFEVAGLDHRALAALIVGRPVTSTPSGTQATGAPPAVEGGPVPRLAVRGLRSRMVHGVDLDVMAGEVLGVAGLLGSGREELAYALVGAVGGAGGEVAVDGRRLRRLDPVRARQAGIGLVPGNRQAGSAVTQFDVKENITLPALASVARWGRVQRHQELRTARRWIDALSLRPPDPHRRFSLLSGGNQQKVILAKWFNTDPRVVVVDDPTAGVDVGAREALYEVIAAQAARGVAFLVTSSDHEDLLRLCSRILVLRDGRVAAELRGPEITEERLLVAAMGRSA